MLYRTALKKLLFTLAMLTCSVTESLGQNDTTYRLDPDAVSCLLKNSSAYQELVNFPTLISIQTCPVIPENPIVGMVIGQGPNLQIDTTERFDSLIYLLKQEEMQCLLSVELVGSDASVVIFKPRLCKTEVVLE